jgi:TldD protein
MLDQLKALAAAHPGWIEMRYLDRQSRNIRLEKGRLDESTRTRSRGVGVRVIEDGAFGFASTTELEPAALRHCIAEACANARALARRRNRPLPAFGPCELARGEWILPGVEELLALPTEARIQFLLEQDARMQAESGQLASRLLIWGENIEERVIVSSDGAAARLCVARPEFQVLAVAEKNGTHSNGSRSVGISGGWADLLGHAEVESAVVNAARDAIELLDAPLPPGGPTTVILDPGLVGLLAHEAVGHTAEADLVRAGAVTQGKLGQRVASERVTLKDSPHSELSPLAAGTLPFDDEGVSGRCVTIIRQGMLGEYMHDRESAALHCVPPTGSARAWSHDNVPLIRMRNTYIEPGQEELEAMIAGTADGLLLTQRGGGQADLNGEFMFNCGSAREIRNGKLGRRYRGATLSGIAFDVLSTVDAVSREFAWSMGAGYCGKGQLAKVDGGGPWLRCRVNLGGTAK